MEAREGPEDMPKRYEPWEHERRWQEFWEREGIYRFDRANRTKPTYSIDTPPPYPSGEFHMGNVLNWCYFDFVARYKRMRGYNVHFPQGWDCHGLPTEVRVEKVYGIRKRDLPIAEFKRLCEKLTNEYIGKMKAAMKALGYSIDWSLEYRTMDPSYYKLTQLSFVILHRMGRLYRADHPVNWCPRCETAIAEAEVEYVELGGELHYIRFEADGRPLTIATTRPELLPACVAVAVHPNDGRYSNLIGREARVPLFTRAVPILADEGVDPSFGTGAVMVCTFGDKADVAWQKRYGLPVIKAIGEDGRMAEAAGEFAGLSIEECRAKMVERLRAEGLLERSEPIRRSVGTCWRCHTPVEILSKPQWFMRTRDMTEEVVKRAEEVRWVPEFAKRRLIDWAKSLDWDWVISRQRVFATPIPVWYCKGCGEPLLAREEWLPVDPRFEAPKDASCPKCGSREFEGEKDVMDTWMDSSITCAVHAGWPDDMDSFQRLFPASLQPNGLDIIRTWDYYLMVKHLALFGEVPYRTVLVNGMVRGTDGRMMHKSYGNYVEASEAVAKYGADAVRQWAASGASTGYDVPFNWGEVEHGKRFLTKLWNAARFVLMFSDPVDPFEGAGGGELIDRWLLSKLERLVGEVTAAMEDFQFSSALGAIRDFVWHVYCDQYLEAIKHRLRGGEGGKEASRTARYALLRAIQLLAPFCPHASEAIYQRLKPAGWPHRSVHETPWPEPNAALIDRQAEEEGDLLISVISEIRRAKAEARIPLKAPLEGVRIYASGRAAEVIKANLRTIAGTCNLPDAQVLEGEGERPVQGRPGIWISLKAHGKGSSPA
ncbi:MAG: valine--tRNA ligase [Candidatus Bathyarchaeia archaeon]